jgi:hypothetical protein
MITLQRKDAYFLGFLYLVVLLIFYPVCFTEYVYTDEVVQLWNYRPGSGFTMFAQQGRWLTELLVSRTFQAADHFRDITYIRMFSLFTWLVCLPIWYVIINRVVARGPGYEYLPFFTCLYLVTSLPFSITVQWASCVELAIANTAGLTAGAIWYFAIRDKEKFWSIPVKAALGSTAAALVSLSAYQSGFCCFVIPFLFHFVSAYTLRKDLTLIKGLAFYFLMYAVYFTIFKVWLLINHMGGDARTGFTDNPFYKVGYFLAQPLKRAFWFNMVINNKSILGRALYIVLLGGWVLLAYIRFGKKNWKTAFKYLAVSSIIFVLAYLPSMVVKENYSSNRTLLAIDMCVWFVCAEMVLFLVKSIQLRRIIGFSLATVFLIAGWYNFNKQFLRPIHEEYMAVKNYVHKHYNKNITTVYFIQTTEDAFQRKYNLQFSMDEFGVPSTFFDWVPDEFTRQLVYELTGKREIANQLTVKVWDDAESFARSGERVTENTLVLNVPELINSGNR